MELAALRRRVGMGQRFRGQGDGRVRFPGRAFTPTDPALFTGTVAVAAPPRLTAADVPLLPKIAAAHNAFGGPPLPVLEPIPLPGPGYPPNVLPSGTPIQSAGASAGNTSQSAGGTDVGLGFSTTPTFGSGIQSDLINKGIDAGVTILSGLLNRPKTSQTSIGGMIGRGGQVPVDANTARLLGLAQSRGSDIKLLPEAGGRKKKYRHMNVANVKALRRSARRLEGFEKLARKTLTLTQRVHVKKRRRR
jgi:hypothetical protein